MLAIPPNRQSASDRVQVCCRSRLLTRSIRIFGALVAFAGLGQRSWSETALDAPQSRQPVIRFVVAEERTERSLITRPKQAPAPAPVVDPPTFLPPLTVGDYDNYIKKHNSNSPRLKAPPASLPAPAQTATGTPLPAARKKLDTITPIETAKKSDQPIPPKPLRIVVAPSVPAREASRETLGISNSPRLEAPPSTLHIPAQTATDTRLPAARKKLDTITTVENAKKPEQPVPPKPLRIVVAPSAPARDASRETLSISSSPRLKAPPATLPAPSHTATDIPRAATPSTPNTTTTVENGKKPDQPILPKPLRVVVAPSVPTHEPARQTINIPSKGSPIADAAPNHEPKNEHAVADAQPNNRLPIATIPTRETTKAIAQADVRPILEFPVQDTLTAPNDPQSTSRSSQIAKLDRNSSEVFDQSTLRVAKVAGVNVDHSHNVDHPIAPATPSQESMKPLPMPSETKLETAPAPSESLAVTGTDGSLAPMTSSSFLPANPESYCFRCGVKCPPGGCNPGGPGWAASRPIPWEVFAQGEYIGPARLAHVPVYRLRVDDQLAFVYRLSGQVSGQPYRLNVRDRLLVQSLTVPEVINREVIIQPDGTVTLPLLGQFRAAGSTLEELSRQLDDQFKTVDIKDPRITVTPLEMNSNLQELRSSVDRRYGQGGQVSDARVSPDGTVQLPAIGLVPAQGLTLEELEREVKARYAQIVEGLEVTPILVARAPRYIFVVGEVGLPGRYAMEGPTTLMQAITLAGSWNVGAQLNNVVVFRRDENWQLMATRVNIRESLLFKRPCPSGEIWLRDSDVVLIPKSPILCADDFINLVFTRGIYGVFPMNATLNFTKLSSL